VTIRQEMRVDQVSLVGFLYWGFFEERSNQDGGFGCLALLDIKSNN